MTVAVACAGIGTLFALFPTLWLHLFTSDEATLRVGTSYLPIIGSIYSLYGVGMGLYFASRGLQRLVDGQRQRDARRPQRRGAL